MFAKLQKLDSNLANRKGAILLQDNARPHIAYKPLKKLKELNIEVLPYPPYFADLSPTDYHLFKFFAHFLTEKEFHKQDNVEKAFKQFIESNKSAFYSDGIEKTC